MLSYISRSGGKLVGGEKDIVYQQNSQSSPEFRKQGIDTTLCLQC